MSIHEGRYAQGTPSWVDLSVDDVDRALEFYAQLFGWEYARGSADTGFYTRCLVDGRTAAGIGSKMEGMEGIASSWTTYIAVDDADVAVKAITSAGGTIAGEPFDVMQYGRMAIALDPNRAAFGIWQAYEMTGAEVINQAGAFTWNENMSRGFDAAKTFYTSVFDYGVDDMGGGEFAYAGLTLEGRAVAGLGELPAGAGADAPAAWMTYFSTTDADAAIAKATELGGGVITGAADTPFGKMACLSGPEGEVFSVIEANDLGDASS